MPFIHSPADGSDHIEVAALLVAMAEEAGIHTREIIVTPHGFQIPDELFAALDPAQTVVMSDPRDEGKTPPPGWEDPIDEPQVEFRDGKVYLKEDAADAIEAEADPEVAEEPEKHDNHEIREWANEQGLKVSARGKIAQDVIDAFYDAHSE